MTKYSVIIPAYNIEKYIPKLLSYINKIRYKRDDIEFILINDGSKDDTHELLNKNQYIQYIRQANQGVSSARNQGLKLSKGEYILFLDADDMYSDKIFSLLDTVLIDNNTIDICFFNYSLNDKSMNKNFEERYYNKETILELFFQRIFNFHVCSICLRKDFIDKKNILFKNDFAWGEDIHFVLNALINTEKDVYYLNKILFDYNLHPKGTMHSVITYDKAISLYLFDDIEEDINLIPNIRHVFSYYRQRYYVFMIKKALTNNIDSVETLLLYKKRLEVLNEKIPIKAPLTFKLARLAIIEFSSFVFYVIKIKSKL